MGEDTIDAICVAFPDGSVYWFAAKDSIDDSVAHARRALEVWKAALTPEKTAQYERGHVMGGFLWCHLLREDFERLPVRVLEGL